MERALAFNDTIRRQGYVITWPNYFHEFADKVDHALPVGIVPVFDCTGWSEAKRRADVFADNALSESSGWDSRPDIFNTDQGSQFTS